jgi:hypothetical protein
MQPAFHHGLLSLIALVLSAAVVRAHDPGLSSLDVSISGSTVSAALSISAADVAALSPGGESVDAATALRELARDAVRLSIDGRTLVLDGQEIETGKDGARIRFAYAAEDSSSRARRLTVTSDIPRRMARGHRELLVIDVDGRPTAEKVLDAEADSMAVDLLAASSPAARNAWSFLTLGVEHILSGYDHLVFLAGLILAAVTVRELLIALTAFTAAHSLSLALVVAGGVHAPPSIVEPLIAASIAWVGVENLIGRRGGSRWWVVFGFGLVHGFGFAGALAELGVGSSARDVAVALLAFNGGVEVGQIAAAVAMLPAVWAIRSRPSWQARLLPVCSMTIVIAGAYWLVERVW